MQKLPSYTWHFRGVERSGPRVIVLGGVHGDEFNTIELIKRFLELLGVNDKEGGVYDRTDISGDLFFVLGNPEAIRKKQRSASGGRDLNRFFSKELLTKELPSHASPDLRRAKELSTLFCETDYLFDIHSTSNKTRPFVTYCKGNSELEALTELMPIQYVLVDPRGVISDDYGLREPCTTEYFVSHYGGGFWSRKKFGKRQGLALCYEIGQASDMEKVDETVKVVTRLLRRVRVIDDSFVTNLGFDLKKIISMERSKPSKFQMSASYDARGENFEYDHGMDYGWQFVEHGQVLGEYADGESEKIPHHGMLLFPKNVKKVRKGENLYYLAVKAR